MNSFLILMFFKERLKKNWSFNQIISNDIYKWKNTYKLVARISLSFDVKMDKQKTTIF